MSPVGRAAVFHAPRQPFEIRELPTPELEPGGVLVRVTSASICGSDLHFWRGDAPVYAVGAPGPVILGHECTGVVHSLGPGVTTDSLGRPLREGDRVVFTYFFPCHRCYWCTRGDIVNCPNRMRYRKVLELFPYCTGGFADYYYLMPGHYLYKVPDELPEEMVTPVNCALAQVIYGLQQGGVSLDDTVVVQGAGGLGLYACAVAKEMGAGCVIAIDGVPQRLELARRCGADETVDLNEYPSPEARVERVRALTEGRGADLVIELVGFPEAIPEGLQMLRQGGTFVEIGNISRGSSVTLDPSFLVRYGVRWVSCLHYHPRVLPQALDFLVRTRGKYALDRIVSHRFPLERITEAFQTAEWLGRQKEVGVTRAIIRTAEG